MSWLDKVKDHVGSGITSSSNLGTPSIPSLSDEAKAMIDATTQMRRVQAAQQAAMDRYPHVYVSNSGSSGYISPSADIYQQTSYPAYSRRDMILMRLNIKHGYDLGFDFIEATPLNEDKTAVFVVVDGKAVTIEDDAYLFPSDTLITQLRLLRK